MVVVWIISILSLITAFFSYMSKGVVSSYEDYSSVEKKTAIKEVSQIIKSWYKNNAFVIDTFSGLVDPPVVSNRWDMTVLKSKRVNCGNGLYGHVYAIVIPGMDGLQTTMDVDTGAVESGKHDIVEVVNGCDIEKTLFLRSKSKAKALAENLEIYFKSHALQEQYGTAKNYFIGTNCGGWGKIQCVNDGRNNAIILREHLNISIGDYTDAYGNVMHFDNFSTNVNATTPPYTARVGFTAPWGDTQWVTAIGNFH